MYIRRYKGFVFFLASVFVGITFFVFFCQSLSSGDGRLDQSVREVNIKAVGDEEFRECSGWEEEIAECIKRVSGLYEKQFGIKFKLRVTGEWASDNSSENMQALLKNLKEKVEKNNSDLVIGFTRQTLNIVKCVFNRTELGVALPFSDYLMVRAYGKGGLDYNNVSMVLAHELGHAFGALHVDNPFSVMNTSICDESIFRFDNNNQKVIELSKFIDFDKGVLSISETNLEQIIDRYKDSLKIGYESASRHFLIGYIYDKRGMTDKAILEYKKAIESDEKDIVSLIHLGIVYAGNGQYDDAIAVFNKAVRLDSKDVTAHINLGLVLIKNGLLDEAVDHVKKAIRINNNPEAHCLLGGIYIQKGLFDQAIFECKKALEIRQNYSSAHYNLGIAYHKKKMYNDAIREYKTAIEETDDNLDARNNLGVAFYEQGLFDKAEVEYIRILNIDPGNKTALSNFEAVLIAKKTREEVD